MKISIELNKVQRPTKHIYIEDDPTSTEGRYGPLGLPHHNTIIQCIMQYEKKHKIHKH